MKKTIEKYSFWMQIWTLVTVLISVIIWTFAFAEAKSDMEKWINKNSIRIENVEEDHRIQNNWNFSERLSVVETKQILQQNYLYSFKSDIKKEVEWVEKKIDQIIKILLNK